MPEVLSEADTEKAAAIFAPWAKKWALESQAIICLAVADTTLETLGVNRNALRRDPRILALMPPDIRWAVEALTSPERKRAKEGMRQLARESLRAKGFNLPLEKTRARHVDWWFQFRVLRRPWQSLELETKWSKKQSTTMSYESFTENILRPIDEGVGWERKAGPPPKLR
jgi:hypothetical protein